MTLLVARVPPRGDCSAPDVLGNKPLLGRSDCLLVTGAQRLALGILGEYMARILDEVKARPRSIIREICGFAKEPREG
jgi:hypothetical protein